MLALPSIYADLLSVLTEDRLDHSLAVGRKAAAASDGVEPWMRSDLVASAMLHDIGYGHVVSGFHPLDGARFLAAAGFSTTVCHLVAHHTASTYEADERGIALDAYAEFGGTGNNFHRSVDWSNLVVKAGLPDGFHFHDLRHTGNNLAAASGESTRELMHRMGHGSMRAALIYQHATDQRAREIATRLSEVVESRKTDAE